MICKKPKAASDGGLLFMPDIEIAIG